MIQIFIKFDLNELYNLHLIQISFKGDSESKDSSHPEPKEWFYDDEVMHDVVDPFEDRGDSDFDYDDNHYKKKRRSRKTPGDLVNRRGRGRGRGRRNNKGGDCDTPRSTNKRHCKFVIILKKSYALRKELFYISVVGTLITLS